MSWSGILLCGIVVSRVSVMSLTWNVGQWYCYVSVVSVMSWSGICCSGIVKFPRFRLYPRVEFGVEVLLCFRGFCYVLVVEFGAVVSLFLGFLLCPGRGNLV
jgi:hypothetical protein